MSKKWIQIWYSWGDQEPPIAVPHAKDPWEELKKLAFKEAEIAFREHEDSGPVGLEFYEEEGRIILHYPYDGEICYYLVTNSRDFDPETDSEE